MAPVSSQQPWWELELIPKRRTELPDTKAKMPTMQELYKAVKHGMTVSSMRTTPLELAVLQALRLHAGPWICQGTRCTWRY